MIANCEEYSGNKLTKKRQWPHCSQFLFNVRQDRNKMTPTLVPGKNDTKSGRMGPFTAPNIFLHL